MAKPIEKLDYKELKAECISRRIQTIGKTVSNLKVALAESRKKYPNVADVPEPTAKKIVAKKGKAEVPAKKKELHIPDDLRNVKADKSKLAENGIAQANKVAPKKEDSKKGTKIAEILELYKKNKSYKEIEAAGYNITTVRIQCAKYKNSLKAKK